MSVHYLYGPKVGSFDEFYRRHHARIASLIRAKVHSVTDEDIEDVLQEAWLTASQKLENDASDKAAYHYVALIAQQRGWKLAKKDMRRRELAPAYSLDEILDAEDAEREGDYSALMRSLSDTVLDPADVVVLRERLRDAVAA